MKIQKKKIQTFHAQIVLSIVHCHHSATAIFPLYFSLVEMATKMVKPQCLNDLSDEILKKIMFWLPIEELYTVSAVCKRFRLLAYTVFKQHYAKHIIFTDPIDRFYQTMRIIKCFGQFIDYATVDGCIVRCLNQMILKLIARHCRSLKKLRLVRYHIDKTSIGLVRELVVKLNTIELLYCTIDTTRPRVTYNIALKDVENLKELVFIGADTEIDLKFLNKKWSNLEKLQVIGPKVTGQQQLLAQILKKNRGMKHFSYLPNEPTPVTMSWLRSFDNNVRYDIEELSMELAKGIDYSNLFKAMTKLRRISINCSGYKEPIHGIIDKLVKLRTLEVLSLWHVNFHEISTIPMIDGLKTFELREVEAAVDRSALVEIVSKRWNNVENVYLDHSTVYSADNLGTVIENMVQLKNLYLCDVRSFCLLPSWGEYLAWCAKRSSPVQIFIDSRCLPSNHTNIPDQPVMFRAFNNRISQMVNAVCGSSFK